MTLLQNLTTKIFKARTEWGYFTVSAAKDDLSEATNKSEIEPTEETMDNQYTNKTNNSNTEESTTSTNNSDTDKYTDSAEEDRVCNEGRKY